jgi:hypothetical protein
LSALKLSPQDLADIRQALLAKITELKYTIEASESKGYSTESMKDMLERCNGLFVRVDDAADAAGAPTGRGW